MGKMYLIFINNLIETFAQWHGHSKKLFLFLTRDRKAKPNAIKKFRYKYTAIHEEYF